VKDRGTPETSIWNEHRVLKDVEIYKAPMEDNIYAK
jgi:hypothetical protein